MQQQVLPKESRAYLKEILRGKIQTFDGRLRIKSKSPLFVQLGCLAPFEMLSTINNTIRCSFTFYEFHFMKNKKFIQILLQLFSKFIATFFDQKEKDISPPNSQPHREGYKIYYKL